MILYQIDAFTDKVFSGNPAGVIILDNWPDDKLMQSIGAENNLPETAFIVPEGNDYRIRWFTPAAEVDLCGHATLASAYVMFNELAYPENTIRFQSKSGLLTVTKDESWLTLDFPADVIQPINITADIQKCSSANILEAYEGRSDYMFVLADQKAVKESHFDLTAISALGNRGVIVTAEGDDVDFVSRFFAPAVGINEDPVTGSAHTTLTPYWSNRLSKKNLTAKQISPRGGDLKCELNADRVLISGQAVMYMRGEIKI
ncbi:MAG TPA: PhzF family phenazine biosynthesis protein [Saprospiraceae bacterium]|nr:PhzF family phenazine biosynthesis protein [Saprospiraceae bacterium]